MSRTSRIPHPPGSRFVAIHQWAVTRWGFAEAAVVGLLDFFDRVQPTGGLPLASRQRIVAELQGIVGRDGVDRALRILHKEGVLVVHKTTTAEERNLQTRVDYGLDIDGIALILNAARSPGNSENQESRQVLNSALNSGLPSIDIEVENAAAAHAPTPEHVVASAAAPSSSRKQGKVRVVRESGIVTWCADDPDAAERIEKEHSGEAISFAISAVLATGKDPVPGLVLREILQQYRKNEVARHRNAAEIAYQKRLSAPPSAIDKAAIQRGDAILAQLRQKQSAVR